MTLQTMEEAILASLARLHEKVDALAAGAPTTETTHSVVSPVQLAPPGLPPVFRMTRDQFDQFIAGIRNGEPIDHPAAPPTRGAGDAGGLATMRDYLDKAGPVLDELHRQRIIQPESPPTSGAGDAEAVPRWKRFNDETGALYGGNEHPDRCVCQEQETGRYAGTPHRHYSNGTSHGCARCSCTEYRPAIPATAQPAPQPSGNPGELPAKARGTVNRNNGMTNREVAGCILDLHSEEEWEAVIAEELDYANQDGRDAAKRHAATWKALAKRYREDAAFAVDEGRVYFDMYQAAQKELDDLKRAAPVQDVTETRALDKALAALTRVLVKTDESRTAAYCEGVLKEIGEMFPIEKSAAPPTYVEWADACQRDDTFKTDLPAVPQDAPVDVIRGSDGERRLAKGWSQAGLRWTCSFAPYSGDIACGRSAKYEHENDDDGACGRHAEAMGVFATEAPPQVGAGESTDKGETNG